MRTALALLLAALLTGTIACSDSPTAPIDEPLVFSGDLLYQGSVEHFFTLQHPGAIQIKVLDLVAKLVEIDPLNPLNLVVGLGLGRPDGSSCSTTSRTNVAKDSLLAFGLSAGDYCIVLFDSGRLPEDAVIGYSVLIDPTE